MIGKVIGGRYEIVEKLGEGGMANVYKAKCKILKRFTTIKILKQELTNDEEFVRKFKDEAMEVAKLSDNNIVKVYDIGEEGDLHYIVMEYIDGKTLKEYITDNGVLSIKIALDFSIQICNALVVAHGIDLIHRDIKSQNILVSNSGNIKVTDFGIAKSSDSATITNSGKILGSAYYISPEQARGNFVDCRSDIYSFGVVMYEMFTGKLPFTQGTPVSVALQHIQVEPVEPVDIVKKLPIGINNLIIKCLQKNPSMRYNSAKEIREDLIALQSNKKHVVSKCNMLDKTMVMSTVTSKDLHKNKNGKKSKKKSNKGLIITLFILILVIASVFIFIKTNTFSKGVVVPSPIGKIGVEYERELESLGLNYVVSGYVESELEKNFVVDTYPKFGTNLRKGDTVKIVLSDGPELIDVPDVINMPLDRAKIIIKNSGLLLGDVEERYSDVYERGVVMIQNPSANSEVGKGEEVSIVVSKGSETRLIIVPEFVGLYLVEAQNLSNLNGININLNPVNTDNKELDGKIFYQSIPNGIEVKSASVIDLSYYKYVEEPEDNEEGGQEDTTEDSSTVDTSDESEQKDDIVDDSSDEDVVGEDEGYNITSIIVVPDLKDMTISEAKKTMNAMGLTLDTSDFVDEDIIKQVDHYEGEEVLIGTTIKVESVY